MASDPAFTAFLGVFPSERQHVTAMATPVCTDVRKGFESVRDSVLDLVFVSLLLLMD
jgi:hypothetical protein